MSEPQAEEKKEAGEPECGEGEEGDISKKRKRDEDADDDTSKKRKREDEEIHPVKEARIESPATEDAQPIKEAKTDRVAEDKKREEDDANAIEELEEEVNRVKKEIADEFTEAIPTVEDYAKDFERLLRHLGNVGLDFSCLTSVRDYDDIPAEYDVESSLTEAEKMVRNMSRLIDDFRGFYQNLNNEHEKAQKEIEKLEAEIDEIVERPAKYKRWNDEIYAILDEGEAERKLREKTG